MREGGISGDMCRGVHHSVNTNSKTVCTVNAESVDGYSVNA